MGRGAVILNKTTKRKKNAKFKKKSSSIEDKDNKNAHLTTFIREGSYSQILIIKETKEKRIFYTR